VQTRTRTSHRTMHIRALQRQAYSISQQRQFFPPDQYSINCYTEQQTVRRLATLTLWSDLPRHQCNSDAVWGGGGGQVHLSFDTGNMME